MLAGPVEATALGNVLVQARGAGLVGSLAELRAIAAASARPQTFEPAADRAAEYERFLAVTRLADHAGAALPDRRRRTRDRSTLRLRPPRRTPAR